jgi:hypothetical protein
LQGTLYPGEYQSVINLVTLKLTNRDRRH